MILFFALLLNGCANKSTTPAATQTPTPTPQELSAIRGVWIPNVQHTNVLLSRENIDKWLTDLSQMGFNSVFVVVWTGGRTLYPSKVMKDLIGIEIDERVKGRDPLKEMIDVAKTKNMKVFAWFEYGFAAENSGVGKEILLKKPNWAAIGRDGNPVTKNGFKWLNSLDTEVQDFMFSLLMEVVENYEVAGIQGDDRLPAMPTEAGYDKATVALYQKENNNQMPPDNTKDAQWVNWRANLLNKFMEKMYKETKKRKPNMQVIMSPSIFPFSRDEYLQDWITWVKNGWVDAVSPQIYRYNIEQYTAELTKITTQQLTREQVKLVYPGVLFSLGKTYQIAPDLLEKMVNENRRQGIIGEVFFYNEGVVQQKAMFEKFYNKK